jgi:cystathionine beta-lyase
MKLGVTIVSDEIWADFVYKPREHYSFGRINDSAVIATAPSKTFNLAGLQVSNLFVRDSELRRRLKHQIAASGYSQLNTLGLVACESAYTKGEQWLSELLQYLQGNISYVRDFVHELLPRVKLIEPEATYLLWLDFSAYGLQQKERRRVGVGICARQG